MLRGYIFYLEDIIVYISTLKDLLDLKNMLRREPDISEPSPNGRCGGHTVENFRAIDTYKSGIVTCDDYCNMFRDALTYNAVVGNYGVYESIPHVLDQVLCDIEQRNPHLCHHEVHRWAIYNLWSSHFDTPVIAFAYYDDEYVDEDFETLRFDSDPAVQSRKALLAAVRSRMDTWKTFGLSNHQRWIQDHLKKYHTGMCDIKQNLIKNKAFNE